MCRVFLPSTRKSLRDFLVISFSLHADDMGPDILHMTASGVEPGTAYTVYLTKRPASAIPSAQFIGEFKTDRHGNGRLTLVAEIVNAFASANQSLADLQGIAGVAGAGGLGTGANTIPLNWIRVYFAEGGMNVFGRREAEFGGGIALTSEDALP